MECPYPDCTGEIESGETYCPECGRSLAPLAVRAALAGIEARNSAQVPATQSSEIYRPPIVMEPIQTTAPRPASPSPSLALWLIVIVAIGGFLLLFSAFTTVGLGGASIGLAPELFNSDSVQDEFDFQLRDLSAANNWSLIRPLKTTSSQAAGSFMIKRGASYAQQGAGDKIVTLIVSENNRTVVELAASASSAYAGISPGWAVAQQGAAITSAMPSGLTLELTPMLLAIDSRPLLPTTFLGNQPAFTKLTLHARISGSVNR